MMWESGCKCGELGDCAYKPGDWTCGSDKVNGVWICGQAIQAPTRIEVLEVE